MPTVTINYVAVVIATVAAMAIGAVWYSPVLFAKEWMKLVGKSESDLKKNATQGYVLTAVAWLVVAYILAHFIGYTNSDTFMNGAVTGFWAWIGFTATTGAINTAFSGRSWKLWVIDNGYHLVALLVMGAIIAQMG